jgi:hypothetical protein
MKKAPPLGGDGAQIVNIAPEALELGRQIAVDLKADADFDECRCGPGHDCFLAGFSLA